MTKKHIVTDHDCLICFFGHITIINIYIYIIWFIYYRCLCCGAYHFFLLELATYMISHYIPNVHLLVSSSMLVPGTKHGAGMCSGHPTIMKGIPK